MKTEITEHTSEWTPIDYTITFETREELINFLYAMSILSGSEYLKFDYDATVEITSGVLMKRTENQVAGTINSLVPADVWQKLSKRV